MGKKIKKVQSKINRNNESKNKLLNEEPILKKDNLNLENSIQTIEKSKDNLIIDFNGKMDNFNKEIEEIKTKITNNDGKQQEYTNQFNDLENKSTLYLKILEKLQTRMKLYEL